MHGKEKSGARQHKLRAKQTGTLRRDLELGQSAGRLPGRGELGLHYDKIQTEEMTGRIDQKLPIV